MERSRVEGQGVWDGEGLKASHRNQKKLLE